MQFTFSKISKPLFCKALVVSTLALSLGACALDPLESHVTPNRAYVEQTSVAHEVTLDEFMVAGTQSALAQHYSKTGEGPLYLTVTYDPSQKGSHARGASNHAADLSDSLRKKGVEDIKVDILPIKNDDPALQYGVLVSYSSLSAKGPKDCEMMAGYDGRATGYQEGYKIGCTLESLIAKQVSRPGDLVGQGKTPGTTDARRLSNQIDLYRSGAPSEELEGTSASDGG